MTHPQRHLAVISQQGHIKDEAAQELLQHGGPQVPAEQSEGEIRELLLRAAFKHLQTLTDIVTLS